MKKSAMGLTFCAVLATAVAAATSWSATSLNNLSVRQGLVERFRARTEGAAELEFDFGGGLLLVTKASDGQTTQQFDNFGGGSTSMHVAMTGAGQEFELLPGDVVFVAYNGGQELTVCLPRLLVTNTAKQFFIATDGSTYHDAALTQLAAACH